MVKPRRQNTSHIRSVWQVLCPCGSPWVPTLWDSDSLSYLIRAESEGKIHLAGYKYMYLSVYTWFGSSGSLFLLLLIFITTKQLLHTLPSKSAINLDLLLVNFSGHSSSLRLITRNKVWILHSKPRGNSQGLWMVSEWKGNPYNKNAKSNSSE